VRLLRTLASTLRVAARRQRFEDGMSEEMRFHVEAYADDLVRRGVPRDEAFRRARVAFGNPDALKEELRSARGQRLLDELRQDVRYAGRRFFRSRGPAMAAVLALGVGVNLAVFSVIHAALVRPLPHPEPDRLIAISSVSVEHGREHLTSPLDFFDFERRASSLRVAGYFPPGFTITGDGEAERVGGARASSGIFAVLGVQPALGRGFLPDEDRAGTAPVAVISHNVWARRYQRDPSVIGRPIVLSGRAHTLVGVLPEGFHAPAMWPRMPDVWVPIGLDPNVARRDARMLRVLGRMKPGVTVEQARAELDAIAGALASEYPASNRGTGATAAGLADHLTRDIRGSLYVLAAAVIALLLVACGNTAGLLAGSTLERQHEFATRLAIGASRSRIVRQLIAESALIGMVAGGAGFLLAVFATDLLIGAATAARVPRAAETDVGWPILLAGVVLSVACTTACALVAAFELTRGRDLRLERSVSAATPRRNRVRAALICLEAAFSLALLVAAGLLVRSFHELRITRPGFESAHTFTARISPPSARYPAGAALAAFYDRVVERVRALPGVEAASVVDWLPVSGSSAVVPVLSPGAAAPPPARTYAELRVVGVEYFRTMQQPLVAGRVFDRRDVDGAPPAVVINEALARAYFTGVDPIGRRLALERSGGVLDAEVVGVVGDVREVALAVPPGPAIYAPKTQQPWMRSETRDLVVRSAAGLAVLAPAIHTVIRELEPDVPRPAVLPIEDVMAQALTRPGFYASAVATFALTAVLLAAFGIFGTVASAVTERRREIGIRLALGASRRDVLTRAARYGALPTMAGLVLGIPLTFLAGRVVRQQLYGVGPADWVTLVSVGGSMALVAGIAALLPAIRATRIDPAAILRHDTR
jgi:putative ABC transport system permease protein